MILSEAMRWLMARGLQPGGRWGFGGEGRLGHRF